MTDRAPGMNLSYSNVDSASPNKPKWLGFTGSKTLSGTAVLPSGYRRFAVREKTMFTSDYSEREVTVYPVSLPSDTVCPWRVMIYKPLGPYLIANGLPGAVPTIGTPKVRLTDNGPSRAVVRIPVSAGILSSSFTGWSDGNAAQVERGMEITVEYRTGGQLVLVFRGRIFEIESGEYVTITAYDRLMDLALYSDQYIPDTANTYVEDEVSLDRASSGSNYVYTMDNEVGTLNTAYPVDTLRIDATGGMGFSDKWLGDGAGVLIHNFPSYGGYTLTDGMRIYRLAVDLGTAKTTITDSYTATVTFYLYSVSDSNKSLQASWSASTTVNVGSSNNTYEVSVDIPGGYLVSDASKAYLGVSLETTAAVDYLVYLKGVASGSHLTTSTYYLYSEGSWSSYTSGAPEIAVDFDYIDTATNISGSVSIGGAEVTLAQGTAPSISETYVSTIELEVGICISYYITGAISLQSVVSDLIAGAGCVASIPSSLGLSSTSYYMSSTYDYLTCIHELIREADAGVRDSLSIPGTISVLPRHTVDENPVETFSTDPSDGSEQSIVSHSLTVRWMAEKATVAILAENATSSGLPIALETDDWLMTGSLVKALSTPMRSVTTDTSSGTHALLANAAGGKVVQLHTNTVEGSITLAGYRPDLWDLTGSGEGGLPIALTVPEYGISDTVAIPTEMEIGDGVTVVTLDNVRRADRSEVANSMGLTADAISSASGTLPDTIWIFARADQYSLRNTGVTPSSMTEIDLLDSSSSQVDSITDANYLKLVKDAAGYCHAVGVIPAASVSTTFEVAVVRATVDDSGTTVQIYGTLNVPKYILAGQNVHVDIRWRAA